MSIHKLLFIRCNKVKTTTREESNTTGDDQYLSIYEFTRPSLPSKQPQFFFLSSSFFFSFPQSTIHKQHSYPALPAQQPRGQGLRPCLLLQQRLLIHQPTCPTLPHIHRILITMPFCGQHHKCLPFLPPSLPSSPSFSSAATRDQGTDIFLPFPPFFVEVNGVGFEAGLSEGTSTFHPHHGIGQLLR